MPLRPRKSLVGTTEKERHCHKADQAAGYEKRLIKEKKLKGYDRRWKYSNLKRKLIKAANLPAVSSRKLFI